MLFRSEPEGHGFHHQNVVCCTIRKGEYVGICGESGVGKSTLFNLLLGFITPDKGAIRGWRRSLP